MKKCIAIVAALILLLTISLVTQPAFAAPTPTPVVYPSSSLQALSHNCPNTGIMVPSSFDPLVTSYILTVASWVSRVTVTPFSMDSGAAIYVNGQYIVSGHQSQEFVMTDKPQAVTISVSNYSGTTVYTVFLQRRPSEARTRVSLGYLKDFYQSSGKWYAKLDLVTVTYANGYTNQVASFSNQSTYLYKHQIAVNCLLYSGNYNYPQRQASPAAFRSAISLDGTEMFHVVYLEDEIVSLTPYSP